MMESYILGVDEAGRGPVLGPMVISGVLLDVERIPLLTSMGIGDSKKLSRKKRESLFDSIIDEASWLMVCVIWPELIDTYVENNALNKLEANFIASIINGLPFSAYVYIDSPQEPDVFAAMIAKDLIEPCELNCMFKADQHIPSVSAASIIAKVFRDNIIDELKIDFGDFGSGYPSDSKTKLYVERLQTPSYIVRKSWKTYKNSINGDLFSE